MFDHGLDSIAIFLMPMSLFTIVSTTVHAIDEFYIAMLVLMAGFFISHWEKYNTSVLYLPWAYDVSQVVSFTVENLCSFMSALRCLSRSIYTLRVV